MESKADKTQILVRAALCGGLAAILWAGANRLPLPEDWQDWLAEHRTLAIAGAAAVLYGLSLAVLPPEEAETPPEYSPCDGYEPTEDLR